MKNKDFRGILDGKALPDPTQIDCNSIIEEIWEDYFDSATSLLPELESSAMELESGNEVESNTANIKRILHCIKGESGMAGVQDVHDLCHQIETALENLEDNLKAADIVLKAKDWMNSAIEYIQNRDQDSQQAAPEASEKDNSLRKARSKDVNNRVALAVDDAVVCRKRVRMLLRNYFDVRFATNGREGYEMYVQSYKDGNPFDLVTLDINMPEMNGHETLEAIRQWETEHGYEGLEGVKVIMTTSEGSSKHVFKAFREGCEAYVVKSNMGDKMLEEVAKLGLFNAGDYADRDLDKTIRADADIYEAIEKMLEMRVCMPVVDSDGVSKGVLCEADVLKLMHSSQDTPGKVSEFARKDLPVFDVTDSLIDVANALVEKNMKTAVIIESGKYFGAISQQGLITHILNKRRQSLAAQQDA